MGLASRKKVKYAPDGLRKIPSSIHGQEILHFKASSRS